MINLTITDYDREVYEKELKNFLPEEFIDVHVHSFKNTFDSYGASNGGSAWPRRVADEMTTEQMYECYTKLFPENKVTPLVFGACLKNLEQTNNYVREESAKHGYPKLYRTTYDMDVDELEKNVKEGGFLGLKPYLTNCPPYIPASEIRIFDFLPHEQLRIADKNGWIIMLHIPRNERLKDRVNLAQLMEIEEKYPNVKLIVAHIGRAYSKEDIGNAFDILKDTKNMLFDFTANVCDDVIKACVEAVGTKRLMFGSDLHVAIMRMYRIVENGVYYNVVPRGIYGNVEGEPHMRETDEKNITLMIYEQMRALKRVAAELKLKDNDIEDILNNNAKRILNLK